eukprot:jgi/Mesvir1/160/Mv13519-RA.1
MFASLVQDHENFQRATRESNDKILKVAKREAGEVVEGLVDTLNSDVSRAFSLEKEIQQELKYLQANTQRLQAGVTSAAAIITELDTALKTVGDFSNWMEVMAEGASDVALMLEKVAGVKERGTS